MVPSVKAFFGNRSESSRDDNDRIFLASTVGTVQYFTRLSSTNYLIMLSFKKDFGGGVRYTMRKFVPIPTDARLAFFAARKLW